MQLITFIKLIASAWAFSAMASASDLAQTPINSINSHEKSLTLRVLTYNVRYDSCPNNITVNETIASLPKGLPETPQPYYNDTAEQPWSTRRIDVANNVLFPKVDIYGGQELLKRQVDDLQELLGNDWAWIGIGRDDGKTLGEYSVIFYQKNVIDILHNDTFWISETPFTPSKYPHAGSNRTCITARIRTASNQHFTMMNTHLDEQSADARKLGASLILYRARYEAAKSRRPVILTGDFNSPPTDGAYQIVTGEMKPVQIPTDFREKYKLTNEEGKSMEDFKMINVLLETPVQRRAGNIATFTGFNTVDDFSEFARLDYIFGSSNGGWSSEAYFAGTSLRDSGIHASDHRPVYADIRI